MILALGAMILLAMIIFRVNQNSLATEDVFYDASFGILGTSITTSIIEEASRKSFDEKSDTVALDKTTQLTTAGSLGKDGSEDPKDYTTFNDFDDFNGYTKVDSSMPSAIFDIACEVFYVSDANPDVKVTTPTWHKKIIVTVSSKFMRDTIRQSSVYSYWNFR